MLYLVGVEDGGIQCNLLVDEMSMVETMSANLSVLFYSIFTYHKKYKTHCYSVSAVHEVYLTFLHSTRSLVFQLIILSV